MQPDELASDVEPVFDVRILVASGRPEQRSGVFADAGLFDALRWMVEAAGTTVIGNAAWQGARGMALSRQRGGKPSPRLAAHAVARRFVMECFGDVVQVMPYAEEMLADGRWPPSFTRMTAHWQGS